VSAQIARRLGLHKAPDDIGPARAAAILAQLDLGDWEILIDPTAEDLAAVFEDGEVRGLKILELADGETTTNEARALFGLAPVVGGDAVPAIVNQVNERAVEWAKSRAADLVTQIEENTRDMLRATVVDAIEGGWGAAELADRIGESAAFDDSRAGMVARTEIIAANNSGNMLAYRESGVATGKEWLLGEDPCDICIDNADQGVIPLDDDFDSGDDAPPAHPRCECSVAPSTEPLDEAQAAHSGATDDTPDEE